MARTKNPIFTRWDDPFYGMSGDYISGLGDGDYNAGYDIVINRFIKSWNEMASKPDSPWPMTSREYGLEWRPVLVKRKVMRQLEDGTVVEPSKKG